MKKTNKSRSLKIKPIWYIPICIYTILGISILYAINPTATMITIIIVIALLVIGVFLFIYYGLPLLLKKKAIEEGSHLVKKNKKRK